MGDMSMMSMRMPSQTWLGAAASFLLMWVVMMVPMMLPVLIPMLLRYRRDVGRTRAMRLGWLTSLVGVAYFFAWIVVGVVVFAFGVVSGGLPVPAGAVVLIAGLLQFTGWKSRRIAACSATHAQCHPLSADVGTAWRHGLRLGLHCLRCCGNLMVIALVLGVMDLRVMTVVAAAITAERLTPASTRAAHAIGAIVVGAGLFLIMAPP
jgi:predicted metal-binding membrane protein